MRILGSDDCEKIEPTYSLKLITGTVRLVALLQVLLCVSQAPKLQR